MKIRQYFLSMFVAFSLLGFSANADPCTSPITSCMQGSDPGLHCSETTASCEIFSSGYSSWNPNTCIPSRVYDGVLFAYFIQYTCNTNMILNGSNQCVCNSNYYMVNGSNYTNDPLNATGCNACSAAQVNGSICTCAGGTAAPACHFPVTLNINGGTGTPSNTAHCTGTSCVCPDNGTACALPSSGITAPSGYVFDGWNSAANGSGTNYGTSYTFSSGSITIYARWKKAITFNGNGGIPASQTLDCYHGGNLTFPMISGLAAPSGFSVYDNLWYQNNDGTGTSYISGNAETCDSISILTFYPKWGYVVTYDGNGRDGGAYAPNNTQCFRNLNCGLSTIPAMTRTGHTLDTANWNTNAAGTGTDYANGLTPFNNASGNINLFAKWTINTISVSYDGNTNTGGNAPLSPTSFQYGSTTNAPSNTYTKTGYTFTGWQCTGGNTSCDGDIIQPGDNIGSVAYSGTITLTAQWNIANYTITYNLDGGTCTGGTCLPTTYNINSPEITLPIPTKSGNIFAGWHDDNSGLLTTTIPAGSYGHRSFTASWTTCGAGSWVNAGNCEVCTNGYYCTGNFNRTACPKATTTDGTDYSNDGIARSAKKDCKMVQGSKICDASGVCYEFTSSSTAIPWTGN